MSFTVTGLLASAAISAGVKLAVTKGLPALRELAKRNAKTPDTEANLVSVPTSALFGNQTARVWPSFLAKRAKLLEGAQTAHRMGDEYTARIYLLASDVVGIPYVWGGQSLAGVDCSGGFLVFHEAGANASLWARARSYRDRRVVDMAADWPTVLNPQAGDAVTYNRNRHVMMNLGGGWVLGAHGGDSANVPGKLRVKGRVDVVRGDYWPSGLASGSLLRPL